MFARDERESLSVVIGNGHLRGRARSANLDDRLDQSAEGDQGQGDLRYGRPIGQTQIDVGCAQTNNRKPGEATERRPNQCTETIERLLHGRPREFRIQMLRLNLQ